MPIAGIPIATTLVYLIEADGGPILVDAGWDHPASWESLKAGITAAGHSVTDVRGVVLTHFHPDHAGLAGRVREASGAWIAMHPAEAELARGIADVAGPAEHLDFELGHLRQLGAPEEFVSAYAETGGTSGFVTGSAVPDRELADGALVEGGRALRAVWTPGHTPGHLCLFLESERWLFAGDHVLSRTSPHVALYPYHEAGSDPLGDYLAALARVGGLGADLVLPAHEASITDLGARLGELAGHHEGRLGVLPGGSAPITAWTMGAAMSWAQPWEKMDTLPRWMALSEAAAHLRRLERIGVLTALPGDRPLRWARAGAARG